MYEMLTLQMFHHEVGEAGYACAMPVDEEMVELPHHVVDKASLPRRVTPLSIVIPVGPKQS